MAGFGNEEWDLQLYKVSVQRLHSLRELMCLKLDLFKNKFEQIILMYEPQSKFQYQDQRVPAQCRDGPIEERSCTDKFCCLLYLVLIIAIVFLSVLCAQHQNLSHSQIQIKLGESQYGKPLLAIQRAILQIILALACVAAVCFILTITTFIFPSLVTYFYMPLMLVLMLLLGGVFLYRFFGQSFPFIAQETQDKYVQKDSLMALVVGIMFIAAFVIALITITCKRQKFRNILPVLRMAKVCFWENCYMFILAIILSVLSILFLYMNIILLQISQNTSHPHIAHFILSGLVILQALWTHGFMQSLSDFLFQAITIFWYFNEKKLGQGYGKCGNNFSASLGLAVRHIGTIIYGSIAAYNPDFVNFWMNTLEKKVPSCYACCCCLHKCICRKISKYSHTMTILQSLDYCSATDQMYSLRRRAKNIIPELYVMGNFFMSLTKILVTMIGVIICYILLLQSNPNLYTKILNIVPPLIVTFLASLEIATHFTNISGLVGDTLSFMYAVDFQIEKSYFGSMEVRSCPWKIKQIIMAVKIGDHADLD